MINYAERIFTRSYIEEGNKYYATFHPEVVTGKDEYDATGRYFVVLLHPTIGLESFYLNRNEETGNYELDDNAGEIVDEEILEWCSNQITSQKKEAA